MPRIKSPLPSITHDQGEFVFHFYFAYLVCLIVESSSLTHHRWHELDPLELVSSVEHCIDKAIKKYEDRGLVLNNIKGVGIANQRETTVVWDSVTGEPLYNAIVWSDTRSVDIVRELKQKPEAGQLQQISGLPLSTYPSASKLLWLLANVPKVKEAYEKGSLAFGTVDTWLVFRLNGGPKANVFVTDSTNASRTMFMNLKKLEYDDFLLNFFDIKGKVHLPRIAPSSDLNAYGSITSGILAGTPILSCLGDQSASLVGQMGFSPGMAKNSYGMGSFTLYNVGYKPVVSQNGLLGTVAYQFDGKAVYALEGSVAVAGSAIKFLQSNFEFIKHPEDINALAQTVDDNGGVVFVTGFSGLYAPYWIDDAKGTLRKTSRSLIIIVITCLYRFADRGVYPSWTHPFHQERPHCASRLGSRLLPDKGHPGGHGARQWTQTLRVSC